MSLLLLGLLACDGDDGECPDGFTAGTDRLCLQTEADTDTDTDTDTDADADADSDSDADTDTGLADGDGDGYGADDCDDTDPEVHPGAVEVCDNGLDDDCDPATGCRWTGGVGSATDTLQGAPIQGMAAGDVNGDGVDDLLVGSADAPLYDGGQILIYAAGALDGAPEATATWVLSSPGEFENHVMAIGDLDGDGVADLVTDRALGAYIIPGPLGSSFAFPPLAHVLSGTEDTTSFSIGDHDGDGIADLAVGDDSFGSPNWGRTSVVMGPITGDVSLSNATVTVLGQFSQSGYDVSLGADFDGDGTSDLAIAERSNTPYFVFQGDGLPAVLQTTDADTTILSTGAPQIWWPGVLSPADVDGDGYGDLAAGMPLDGAGAYNTAGAFVYHGPLLAGSLLWNDGDVVFLDGDPTEYGVELDLRHDIDADGHVDAVIGEYGENNRVHVFFGPFSGGILDGDQPDAHLTMRIPDDEWSLVVGDFDGDADAEVSVSYRSVLGLGAGLVDTWRGVGP